jgi:crotonobetaine/carnitine-CoA ligase
VARPTLAPSQRTLPALLELQARRHGDRVLVRTERDSLTYAEALARAAACAGALAAEGVGRGDRVAVLSENRLEVVELLLGCAWLGATLVPVNTALRGGQLAHVLGDSSPRLLVLEPEHAGFVDDVASVAAPRWLLDVPLPSGDAVPQAGVGPGDEAVVLYTSGTTGPSKGVVCPHAQWYWWAVTTGEVLGVREGDVLYTNLPLFHTNAMNTFFQALLHGGTFALGPRFSASRFWRRLVESEATVTYLLGTMVHILASRDPDPLEREHTVRVALAPATPAALHGPFRERSGIRLVDGWGSTETNFVVNGSAQGTPPGSMGSVTPGFDARVVDGDDEEVPPGVPGELVVRSDEAFAFARGYNGLPEQTLEAWRNLWFHTGDRVLRDEEGWFWFVDRIKDSIRRRGENVSSYEVESVLTSHEAVAAAAVVPVPAEIGDDEVLAFVVLREGATLEPATLIRFCEPRLASFAIPRFVELVGELPVTANGKVEKFRLRERGVTTGTWDRERSELALRSGGGSGS